MLPPLPHLKDYEVSAHNGFLPGTVPLDILPDSYYGPWETVVRNFQSLILAKRLRRTVDALPILETDLLLTDAEQRRAYSILAFIAHGYIWGGDRPAEVSFNLSNLKLYVELTFLLGRAAIHFNSLLEDMSTFGTTPGRHICSCLLMELATYL